MPRTVASSLSWPGMRTHYAWLPPHTEPTTTGGQQIGVAFTRHDRLVREVAGRAVRTDAQAGAVYLTGADPITWLEVGGTTEALEVYPDPTLLRTLAGRDVEVEPAMAVRDDVVFGVASALRRAHVGRLELTDVEGSTLAHRLVGHLLHRYAHVDLGPGRGLLDHRTVKRVGDYVDAHVGGTITLDALAGVAALSPYHFARAFKATTGTTPHGFVTARRLEAAKGLLLGSRTSVTTAAYAVGFSNVSHFRRVFRRHVGVTPGALHG